MIELLKNVLINCRQLDGWKITILKKRKNNLYMTKDFEPESTLQSERINVDVSIYKKFGKQIGDASFAVLLDDFDETNLKKKIEEQLAVCENAQKKSYSLPIAAKIPDSHQTINLSDPLFRNQQSITAKITELSQQAKQQLSQYKNIQLNSFEILAEQAKQRIINSNGLDISQTKTHLHIECIITAKNQQRENEYILEKDVAHFKDLNIKQAMVQNVLIVNDILRAETPTTVAAPVILTQHALKEFFAPHLSLNPIIAHASARLKYMDISNYKKDVLIIHHQKAGSDSLTIYSDPLLSCNPSSQLFDDDGIISKKVLLIENNIFKNYFASNRYAQYLHIPPTGAFGSIAIVPGSTAAEKIYADKKEQYEIIAFASFVPNSISGDFSAEIRLGYKITNSNGSIKRTPFRGGMFTGNIFTLLQDITLSKEIMIDDGYHGPKAIRFNEAMIAGL